MTILQHAIKHTFLLGFTPRTSIHECNEIIEWCKEQFTTNKWIVIQDEEYGGNARFEFYDEKDALLFKIRRA